MSTAPEITHVRAGRFVKLVIRPQDADATEEDTIKLVMEKALSLLEEEYKLTAKNVVFSNLVVRDLAKFAPLNAAYRPFFEQNPPGRSCVQMDLDAPLSLELTAFDGEKRSMHVQSISMWAPANIGPYSQLTEAYPLAWLSGMIALDPPTMTMQCTSVTEEVARCYESVANVLDARTLKPSSIISTIMYYVPSLCSQDDVKDAITQWRKLIRNSAGSGKVFSMTAAAVTRLPRDARVEFEVIACRDAKVTLTGEEEEEEGCASSGIVTFQSHPVKGVVGDIRPQESVTVLAEAVEASLAASQVEPDSVLFVRVFARGLGGDGGSSVTDIVQALRGKVVDCPVVVLPVPEAKGLFTAQWMATSEAPESDSD